VPYMLTTDSPLYTNSQVFVQPVINLPPDNDTPTPTPVVTPTPACVGDCNGDGSVTVDEVLRGVDMVEKGGTAACPPLDANHDGTVDMSEILTALDSALLGCPGPAPATLAEIQQTIFTPSCAIPACHVAPVPSEGLDLSTQSTSFNQLVGVDATEANLPRVDPGHPENSFLVVKVQGMPPVGQGSQMPLTGLPLTADQVQLIRNWILQGAKP